MKRESKKIITRRDFIKDSALLGGGFCLGGSLLGVPTLAHAKKREITFGTASPVGGYMLLATGIARCINDKLPQYNVTPVPEPRTSIGNVRAIDRRERELGLAIANVAYNGYTGQKPFKAKQAINSWFAAHFAIWNVIALESSGIKTIADLKGKKVVVGKPRGTNDIMNRTLLLKAHGLSYGDFKPEMVGLKEAVNLMKDKHVDALSIIAAPPLAAISELSMSRKVRFIPPDKKAMAAIIKKAPFFYSWDFGKSYYPNMIMPESVAVLAINHVVICGNYLSNEMMYNFTKAVFEQIDIIHNVRKDFKVITLTRAPKGLPIPIHPGAKQYYKEKGVL
ncbi:MAG: TAXI family TRAP transporter solute-binding subunit [Deltaproteobacteria bacterium]|nr:TAXI family TRAP transporter solute-binding subunit [Deltaproteobacteria bacterium]MBW1960847.1 TAXI family TRAP transporter solute-binding subunit [Deltaproteobacteria bacterium]MBW2151585.1 TAXI family TRAP transporter solute-binding subunit [Deltaproteobacteria bacterium]